MAVYYIEYIAYQIYSDKYRSWKSFINYLIFSKGQELSH
jgi:hypothetical protein